MLHVIVERLLSRLLRFLDTCEDLFIFNLPDLLRLLPSFSIVGHDIPVYTSPLSMTPVYISPVSMIPVSVLPVSMLPVSMIPVSMIPVSMTPVSMTLLGMTQLVLQSYRIIPLLIALVLSPTGIFVF